MMFQLQFPDEAKSYLECVKQLSMDSWCRDTNLIDRSTHHLLTGLKCHYA